MSQMLQRCRISGRIQDHHVPIFKEIPFRVLDMEITAFETLHDVKSVGFSIEYEGERFVVATDMGVITERAAYYMSRANYLMLECNYDMKMLNEGSYSAMLKDRVKGEKGHLDNEVAAQFVAEHYHEGLRNVFLCHLSQDNNTEEIALTTMRRALEEKGLTVGDGSNAASQRNRNVQICALPRYNASAWFVLV
jgi:phosphoribosyl 1,2-cyclic phosphodiesterase